MLRVIDIHDDPRSEYKRRYTLIVAQGNAQRLACTIEVVHPKPGEPPLTLLRASPEVYESLEAYELTHYRGRPVGALSNPVVDQLVEVATAHLQGTPVSLPYTLDTTPPEGCQQKGSGTDQAGWPAHKGQ